MLEIENGLFPDVTTLAECRPYGSEIHYSGYFDFEVITGYSEAPWVWYLTKSTVHLLQALPYEFFCWNRSGRVPGSRKNYRQNLDHGH